MKNVVRLACGVAIAALVSTTSALAQQPGEQSYHDESVMPDGVVGERIQSLIATLNEGESAVLEQFLATHVTDSFRNFAPFEAHENAFRNTLRRWGNVTFHGIRTYDPPRPDDVIVIVKDSNFEAWRALSLQFDAADDNRISSLGFNDARTPTNVEEASLTTGDLLPEIQRVVERSCEVDVFSGSVLVASGNEVLYSHACGEASKRFHVANNLQTKFNLGSMNKMFTSVAILQLVERGVISVEDPISEYVDETWLPREMTDQITVHHLLSHTSGLGSYFNDTYWDSSRELFRALDDYKPLIRGEELAFEPGARFRYSNTGMFLLGVVIESATGQDYFDYIREHIYAPAGMTNSDSYEMDQPVENLAIGYDPSDSALGYENNLYKHVIKGGPAGGGFSTVEDLHRFALALQGGTLVSEASLDLLWTDHSGSNYGYGFGVEEIEGVGRVVGHGGGFPGLNANLDILLDRGMIVAVMSNYGQAATPIAASINQLVARTQN